MKNKIKRYLGIYLLIIINLSLPIKAETIKKELNNLNEKFNLENYPEVILKGETLIRGNPLAKEIYYLVLESYFKTNQRNKFKILFKGLTKIETNKKNKEFKYLSGINNYFSEKLKEAILEIKSLFLEDPNNNKINTLYINLLIEKQDFSKAIEVTKELKSISKINEFREKIYGIQLIKQLEKNKTVSSKIKLANQVYFYEKPNKAILILKSLLQEKINNEEINRINQLAEYILKLEKDENLSKNYYQIIEKTVEKNYSSNLFSIYKKRLIQIKEYEKLINLYRLKLLEESNNLNEKQKADLYYNIAELYSDLEQVPFNIDNYKRSLKLTESLLVREKLAFQLLLINKLKEAKKNYQKIIEYNNNNLQANFGLAYINYVYGDSKEAEKYLKKIPQKKNFMRLFDNIVKLENKRGKIYQLFRNIGI